MDKLNGNAPESVDSMQARLDRYKEELKKNENSIAFKDQTIQQIRDRGGSEAEVEARVELCAKLEEENVDLRAEIAKLEAAINEVSAANPEFPEQSPIEDPSYENLVDIAAASNAAEVVNDEISDEEVAQKLQDKEEHIKDAQKHDFIISNADKTTATMRDNGATESSVLNYENSIENHHKPELERLTAKIQEIDAMVHDFEQKKENFDKIKLRISSLKANEKDIAADIEEAIANNVSQDKIDALRGDRKEIIDDIDVLYAEMKKLSS